MLSQINYFQPYHSTYRGYHQVELLRFSIHRSGNREHFTYKLLADEGKKWLLGGWEGTWRSRVGSLKKL